jgi:hypothetical protein
MTKILILGGSHSEYPIIRSGINQKHEIFTAGRKRFILVPETSHQYLDYSNHENVMEHVRNNQIEKIIAGCNDFSAISAADSATLLNIEHDLTFEIANELHSKNLWLKTFNELGIPVPDFEIINTHDEQEIKKNFHKFNQKQIIVKPVDMTGGKGIFLANKQNLSNKIKLSLKNSRQSKVIIQERLEGSLHSALTLFNDDYQTTFFADEEIDETFRVRIASMPSSLTLSVQNKIKTDLKKYISFRQLKSGVIHIQFIFNDDCYKIVDVCGRTPGDLFPILLEYTYNFDYPGFIYHKKINNFKPENETSKDFVVRYVENKNSVIPGRYEKNIIDIYNIESAYSPGGEIQGEGRIIFLKFDKLEKVSEFSRYMKDSNWNEE